jgi:putative addiction module CopG family antidote
MSVRVAPDVEAMIREKVTAGRYDDEDEVLREALRALDERDRLCALRASLVRANEQIERGEYVEWSPDFMEQLSREADELVAQGYQPKPDVCP